VTALRWAIGDVVVTRIEGPVAPVPRERSLVDTCIGARLLDGHGE
jgi:hypothetical protein